MSFVFLVGPLAGGFCAAWTVALAIQARDRGVWRVAVAAAAVAAVWLVPLAVAYHHYHGFVSITNVPPVNPTIPEAVIALGLLLPLGARGHRLRCCRRPGNLPRGSVVLLVIVPADRLRRRRARGSGAGRAGHARPAALVALSPATSASASRCPPASPPTGSPQRWRAVPGASVAAAAAVVLVAVAVPSTVLATVAEVVQHSSRVPLACTRMAVADALTAVAIRQPRADQVSHRAVCELRRRRRSSCVGALEGAVPDVASTGRRRSSSA